MTCLILRKKYMRTVVTEDILANYNLAKSLKAKCAPGIELITRIETSAQALASLTLMRPLGFS